MKGIMTRFFKEEEGMATIEIVLIVVILAGAAFLFRGAIEGFFTMITNAISNKIGNIISM